MSEVLSHLSDLGVGQFGFRGRREQVLVNDPRFSLLVYGELAVVVFV